MPNSTTDLSIWQTCFLGLNLLQLNGCFGDRIGRYLRLLIYRQGEKSMYDISLFLHFVSNVNRKFGQQEASFLSCPGCGVSRSVDTSDLYQAQFACPGDDCSFTVSIEKPASTCMRCRGYTLKGNVNGKYFSLCDKDVDVCTPTIQNPEPDERHYSLPFMLFWMFCAFIVGGGLATLLTLTLFGGS